MDTEEKENSFLTGTFISNAKGFGFVEIEGEKEDFFIPENCTNGAFHRDTVQVSILQGRQGKRREAQVVRIVSRGMTRVVGTFERVGNRYGFVIPDDPKLSQDIYIPREKAGGAVLVPEEGLTGEQLYNTAVSLIRDRSRLDALERASARLGVRDASGKIVEVISELLKK